MITNKDKGNNGELAFAEHMRTSGLKMYKKASSGAHSNKGDIVNGYDMTIEVKTVNKLNVKEAWEQVSYDAALARNQPVLAIHYDDMPKNEWIVCLHSEDFIELLKNQNTQRPIEQDRRMQYAIHDLQNNLKRFLKLLEHEI